LKIPAAKYRIFAITWLTYAGYYFCRKNLSLVLPVLHGKLLLSEIQLANIVFGYSLCYALGQFGFGFLSDGVGAKRVVGGGLLLVVASNLLLGVHSALFWLLFFACCNGIGQATGWSGLVKTMASWFGPEQRGVAMAWWGTNYVLGGFLATIFATWALGEHALLVPLGWRRGFIFPAMLLMVITAIYLLGVPNTSQEELSGESFPGARGHDDRASKAELIALLREPSLWIIGVSYFFLELCRYALMFWLPLYMIEHLRYSTQTAGFTTSLYELVGVAGAVIAGYISDRFMQARRAPVCVIMLWGLAFVMFMQPVLAHYGLVGVAFAVAAAGVFSYGPDTLLSGAGAQDVGGPRGAATASGLIDGIGHLGALFSPYLVVLVSARYGWDRLFWVFAASAFIAGLVLTPIWNLKPSHETPLLADGGTIPVVV
jgi:sugar phosphate permease